MDYRIIFPERLLACRTTAHLSQKALGAVVGKSDAAITQMEKGKSAASLDTLIALADYFDVSIDYLVGRTDNPKMNK